MGEDNGRPDLPRCHHSSIYTWQHICHGEEEGKKIWNIITEIHSPHARNTLWPQAIQILCCSFPLIHPSSPSLSTVSRVSETRRRGEECSVWFQSSACTSVPWREKTAGLEEEWRMRDVGGQWTKSAELDYIRLGLSGSLPYKSLPSLKGLHGRWIKPNSERITKGGKA